MPSIASLLLALVLPAPALDAAHTVDGVTPGSVSVPTQAQVTQDPVATPDPVLEWRTATDGNEARYRVREQLARLNFPNDAVGASSEVEGRLAMTPDGRIDAGNSGFTIGLAALTSDSDRRDNFLRRNTLSTDDHPEAHFQPREFRGLDVSTILEAGASNGDAATLEFEIVGDLTIRGVTRQTTWAVQAELAGESIRGRAETRFTFGDFDLTVPSVGSVLSINDDIRLELDFFLVPAGR